MNFSQHIKTIKLKSIDIKYIPIEEIRCQFNPDRYKYWKEACDESLDIKNGPYYHYLHYKDASKYKKLHKLYGRQELWITNNILRFQSMYGDIRKNGFDESKGLPVVLNKPVVINKYNDSYEIYEGHRRLSICLFLGIKQKVLLFEII